MLRKRSPIQPSGRGAARDAIADDPDLQAADPETRRIVEAALPHTMTGVRRVLAVIDAVRYCVDRGVVGDYAECGVWRGGSVLAMILTLQERGVDDVDIHLFDTFEGMTEPTERDTSPVAESASAEWERTGGRPYGSLFDASTQVDGVRRTIERTGYPGERLHFVVGPVEETLPAAAPERLAMLRLDTDWYESTRLEMEHLYPRLQRGGVLIIDDYGHWDGCRQAVDEYFADDAEAPMLHRIDYSGRAAVKP